MVIRRLYKEGLSPIRLVEGRSSELIVNGARVAVKIASPSSKRVWGVNIHRHGKLNESGIDCYLFALLNAAQNASWPLYLVLRAPAERSTYKFTFSSLVRLYGRNIEDFATLHEICQAKAK